jgi:hypothetical protein
MSPGLDPHGDDVQVNVSAAMRAATVHSAYYYALIQHGHSERVALAITTAYITANGLAPATPPDDDAPSAW